MVNNYLDHVVELRKHGDDSWCDPHLSGANTGKDPSGSRR
jgi:hypothetical protein